MKIDWIGSLNRKMLKLGELSWSERILLLQAFILLALVTLSLHTLGMQSTHSLLLARSGKHKLLNREEALHKLEKTKQLVGIAAWYSRIWANCLKKSLVLWFMLRRQGIYSDLRIGVQMDAKEFQAHAWVEYEGNILNDTSDVRQRYITFDLKF